MLRPRLLHPPLPTAIAYFFVFFRFVIIIVDLLVLEVFSTDTNRSFAGRCVLVRSANSQRVHYDRVIFRRPIMAWEQIELRKARQKSLDYKFRRFLYANNICLVYFLFGLLLEKWRWEDCVIPEDFEHQPGVRLKCRCCLRSNTTIRLQLLESLVFFLISYSVHISFFCYYLKNSHSFSFPFLHSCEYIKQWVRDMSLDILIIWILVSWLLWKEIHPGIGRRTSSYSHRTREIWQMSLLLGREVARFASTFKTIKMLHHL